MLARIAPKFPQAFIVANPTGGEDLSHIRDYIADPVAKTITFNPVPPPPPKTDAQVDAVMDAYMRDPRMLSVLEALTAKLPWPVSIDQLKAEVRARGRVNLSR